MRYNFKYLTIDRFGQGLEDEFLDAYGKRGDDFAGYVNWIGRFALENIANSDNLYHDVEHTMLVTTVGQQILLGKHLLEGGVSPREWAHFITALLCHDVGYVRGICRLDQKGIYATGVGEETVELAPGATDAMMTPYHVDRSKLFVVERFGRETMLDIDSELVAEFIEATRFPAPDKPELQKTASYAGLMRAADYIGQVGDPDYLRKIPALFFEFEQIGINGPLGYKNPDDMRKGYASFFWEKLNPYIQDAARFLRATQDGKQWLANLHSHVFQVEHNQD
jgi:hypothetical protein